MVDPAYFQDNSEAMHVDVVDEIEATAAFAGMVNVIDDTEEERLSRLN